MFFHKTSAWFWWFLAQFDFWTDYAPVHSHASPNIIMWWLFCSFFLIFAIGAELLRELLHNDNFDVCHKFRHCFFEVWCVDGIGTAKAFQQQQMRWYWIQTSTKNQTVSEKSDSHQKAKDMAKTRLGCQSDQTHIHTCRGQVTQTYK